MPTLNEVRSPRRTSWGPVSIDYVAGPPSELQLPLPFYEDVGAQHSHRAFSSFRYTQDGGEQKL